MPEINIPSANSGAGGGGMASNAWYAPFLKDWGLSPEEFETLYREDPGFRGAVDNFKNHAQGFNAYWSEQERSNITNAAKMEVGDAARGYVQGRDKKANSAAPRSRMQELYDRLSKPADPRTDPVLAGLMQIGQGQGARRAASAGFRSDVGAGARLGADAARNMSLPYLSAREGMATNLLGQMDQSDLNWAQVDQAQARMDNELSMGKFQMDANNRAATGSGIGGVLGGVLGAVASIPSFGTLAPKLIPAGIGLGSGIGAGIGQASSRRPTFSNYGRGSRYPGGSGF